MFKVNNIHSYIKKITMMVYLSLLVLCCSNVAFAQENLSVRSGDHPTYSRIVFDWTRNVGYSARLIGSILQIDFEANAIPDFSSVIADEPSYLGEPRYEVIDGNLRISFQTRTEGNLRHFRSGPKVVVDLMAHAEPMTIVTNSEPENRVTDMPEADISTNSKNASVDTPATEQNKITPVALDLPSGDGEMTITANSSNDAFVLNYIWNEDVKAAVFIRSNKLWVVFDKYMLVDHGGISTELGQEVLSVEQIEDPGSTILIYSVASGQNARMVKTSRGWELSLRTNISLPQSPIEIGHQSVSSVGENIFLSANDLGNVINIEDPYIGDNISIVPASTSSQGIPEQSNFSEFSILKSAQGIALQLVADDIFVTRHDTGVSVSGQNGLAVSKSKFPILRAALPVAMDGVVDGDDIGPQMLIDFAAWEGGPLPEDDYTTNRHELLYRLSSVSDGDRNEPRWNLAVYDIANGNAAEAFGILQLMGESEPGYIENPSYRAALAVANIKLRRYNEAINLLSHKSLSLELDALLWRSLAYEAIGEYQKAEDDFALGVGVISLQDNDNKAEFLFSSIRTSLALGDVEKMNNQINEMDSARLNAKQLTELDYWRGQMAEQYGDEVLAAEEYDKVIAAGVRQPAAHATLNRVNQQLRLNEIDALDAVDALEKLRFAWRGDDFELELLKQLGDLYVVQKEFREGLSVLRQAATYFPKSTRTAGLTKKMTDIYNDLFLEGGADNMQPLKAMALFLEFRELTPLGADGDVMLRNLANRMVAVDLLNDAASLLEYQVENRLQGVARADIASNLAMIYVMNKEPEKALNILRSTRQSQTPEDIELNRTMIEIRTLVELGRYDEAEVMLEGRTGEVAQKLRSDIYWKTENWASVVDHGQQALGNRWSDSAELDVPERQTVLRIAVALALDENLRGLENLRSQYMDHMAGGMFADAFEVITAKEQKTGEDIRQLTQTIASVDRLETFMDSYRDEFAVSSNLN